MTVRQQFCCTENRLERNELLQMMIIRPDKMTMTTLRMMIRCLCRGFKHLPKNLNDGEILFLVGSGTIRKVSHDLLGRKNWLCSSHICIFHWPLPVITVQIYRLSAHVNVVSVWTKFNGNQTLVWSGMLIRGISHGLYHYLSRCGEESSPSVLKCSFFFHLQFSQSNIAHARHHFPASLKIFPLAYRPSSDVLCRSRKSSQK